MTSAAGREADSVLREIARISRAGLPLAAFVRACLEQMRTVVPFDMGVACVLAPEAQYERFVGCWPEWVADELEGVAFSTEGEPAAMIRAQRGGAAYRARDWPGIGPRVAARHGIARIVSIPLHFDNEYFGSLSLGREEAGGRFSEADLEICRRGAGIVAFAMRREVEQQHVRLRLDRAAALSKLAMMVNASDRLETLYESAMPILRGVLPLDLSVLEVSDGDAGCIVVASDTPAIFAPGDRREIPADELSKIRQPGLLSVEFDTGQSTAPIAGLMAPHGFRRAAAAPLTQDGAFLGVFVVARRSDWCFSESERAFLELFASLLSQACVANRRREEAAAEALEQRFIADLAEAITRASTVDGIANAVQEAFSEIIPGAIATYNYLEDGQLVTTMPGQHGRFRSAIGPYVRQALEEGQVIPPHGLPGAVTDSVRRFGLLEMTAISYTGAVAGGAATGLLFVATREVGYRFNERELRLFRLAARILGPAMENVRKVEIAIADVVEERLISEIARISAAAAKPVELVAALQAPFAQILPGAQVAFGYIEGDEIIFPSAQLGTEMHCPLLTALGEAASRGEALIPAGSDGWIGPLTAAATGSLSAGPVALAAAYSGGAPVGVLGVRAAAPGASFSLRQRKLFRTLANIIGTAMANVRAVEALGRENALHQLVLGSLSDAVILFDHDLSIVFTNASGEALRKAAAHRSRSHVTGRRAAAALPDAIAGRIRLAGAEGKPNRGRSAISIAGEERWFDFESIPLEHRDFSLLLIASDVTAEVMREEDRRRHREELEQSVRLAALGELVSGVAHELNNPLTAILGFSEMLAARAGGPADSQEEVEIIREEAGRARDIVQNLLAITRPNVPQRAALDLESVIRHVLRLRASEWARQGIEGFGDCTHATEAVWADSQQITQVLLNLVVNAEYALQGRPNPRIRITASTIGGRLTIVVADNGIGMDAATRARVFEPFFSTKQGSGTGLGLSLSRSIVRSHDGTLTVDSKPGRGARFTIDLPVGEAPGARQAPEPAKRPTRRSRVLVVDDEENIRKLCRRIVIGLGHDCETADSAPAALRRINRGAFDLILCDYRLGAETADRVIEGIEQASPELLGKVVIATGATTDAGVSALQQRYNLTVIAKPYGSAEIARALAAA